MTTSDADIFANLHASVEGQCTSAVNVVCAHCAQPVPAGLVEINSTHQFCCGGCRAVYETLHACGLEAYYKVREIDNSPAAPARPTDASFAAFDSPTFDKLYIEHRPDDLSVVDLALEGITCAACVWLVERLPRMLNGVTEARLSLREATVRITWNAASLSLSQIAQALDRLGYTPHAAKGGTGRELHRIETRRRLVHLGVAAAIMGNNMLLAVALYSGDAGHMETQYRALFRWFSAILGMISLTWPGAVFFRSAITALRARITNLDVPIALALAAGGIAGLVNVILGRGDVYFDSLSVLVFLLLVGRFLQYRQQRRADDAVGLLFNLTPAGCRVVRDSAVIDAPVEALIVGDLIEVRPGELFPADGVIETGRSSVNQALLTGESLPTGVESGSPVFGGSQNVESTLRVRVTQIGQATRVGQLMQLIERGVQEKPPIVQFADRVGRVFLVVLTLAAIGVFAYWSQFNVAHAIDHTVALLIVTCPCVLGLATPLTVAIAIGRLAHRDILVKSGTALERLAHGGAMLLDKTGTITDGRLQLVRWFGDESIKSAVAMIERQTNHPVGRAMREATSGQCGPEITDIVERGDGGVSGLLDGVCLHVGSPTYAIAHGVMISSEFIKAIRESEATGMTAVVIAVAKQAVAVAGLGDRVREGSRESIERMRQMKWQPRILSGDAEKVVQRVAAEVGIDAKCARGQLTPEDKLKLIHTGTGSASGRTTVMIGDGVNDAAALAAADVGIAVHGGAEASLSAADIYIARPGLAAVVDLIETSRRTMRTIHRNLVMSLGYNLLAGVLAASGRMTPLLAAIIMPISSITVLSMAVLSITGWRGAKKFAGGQSWK